MKKLFWVYGMLLLLTSIRCAKPIDFKEQPSRMELQAQINSMAEITDTLNAVINSDFAACPNAGETADALIRKICNIAQAANAETQVALKGELAIYSQLLQQQINAINNNIANNNTTIASMQATITTMQAQIALLETRMTNAEAAILALQNLTASISGVLAKNMILLEIGSENVAAGPLYESALRTNDRTRFNAYVQAEGYSISLPNNPIQSTNGSPSLVVSVPSSTVTMTIATPSVVTWTGHGLVAGAPVKFSTTGSLPTGLVVGTLYYVASVPAATLNTFSVSATKGGPVINTSGAQSGTHRAANIDFGVNDRVSLVDVAEGGGVSSGHLVTEHTVTAVAANFSNFTVNLSRNATATSAFGGTVGLVRRVVGRGLSTVWKSLDPSDTAVRVSNLGSQRYNFVIRQRLTSDSSGNTAELCYDKTSSVASFAVINAAPEGGLGNVVCK